MIGNGGKMVIVCQSEFLFFLLPVKLGQHETKYYTKSSSCPFSLPTQLNAKFSFSFAVTWVGVDAKKKESETDIKYPFHLLG